jgi:hypothetical protein
MALVDATTASGNQSPSSTYILKDDLSVSRESIEGRIRSSCDMEGHTFTALTAVLQNSAAAAKWDTVDGINGIKGTYHIYVDRSTNREEA